jgi:hypothetical protein
VLLADGVGLGDQLVGAERRVGGRGVARLVVVSAGREPADGDQSGDHPDRDFQGWEHVFLILLINKVGKSYR